MDFHKMYKLLQRAQDTYGYPNQVSIAAEELCELAVICNKYVRYPDHDTAKKALKEKLLEESADVVIMLHHLYMIFGIQPEEQDAWIKAKLERLERWLDTDSTLQQTTLDREVAKVEH